MSDDFMQKEFELDRDSAFLLGELVKLKYPWDVAKRLFPDLDGVELGG